MSFSGRRMQERRRAAGLSQRSLGEHLGIGRVRVSEYETGARRPSLNRLARIAAVLGVRVDDLLDDTEACDA